MKILTVVLLILLAVLNAGILVGCGDVNIDAPIPEDAFEDDGETNPSEDEDEEEIDDGQVDPKQPIPTSSPKTVCQNNDYIGDDMAIQKDGHFYETAGKIVLMARTVSSPDEDSGEALMYGDTMRMWAKIPEVIKPVQGRGSSYTQVCLTLGHVNCRYIWGAKVFELDMCDFGVQSDDIVGARFFAIGMKYNDLAPDVMVRAELKTLSPVR